MKQRIYFPGLNGIRFWAALSVVLVHIEQFKGPGFFNISEGGDYESFFFLARIGMIGRDAVTLFFVLSGFLITYLLLSELDQTGTIKVRKFYLRRMLRIWPLYYLLVALGFFGVPLFIKLTGFDGYYPAISLQFREKFALYMLFLPNVAQLMGFFPAGIAHLWTIGVEEQFYLIWPVLLRRFKQHILKALLGVIALKFIIISVKMIHFNLRGYNPSVLEGFDFLLLLVANFPIESMAIGGLGAYIFKTGNRRILDWLFSRNVSWLVLGLMAAHVLVFHSLEVTKVTGMLTDFVIGLLYTAFILNISCNERFPIKMENRVYNVLGNLSYGIYMYHFVVIYVVLALFSFTDLGQGNTLAFNLLLYAVIVGATIGIAALSYYRFERPFLKLKSRFAVVKSSSRMVEPENPAVAPASD